MYLRILKQSQLLQRFIKTACVIDHFKMLQGPNEKIIQKQVIIQEYVMPNWRQQLVANKVSSQLVAYIHMLHVYLLCIFGILCVLNSLNMFALSMVVSCEISAKYDSEEKGC